MATTTNYGWTTPDDTALVKDGAAAIRTLGSSVDTTTKNLNPSTTLGDIEYRSSTANVNTRLPLGTAGQVLKVNSGATAPEWATDASGMTNPMTTTGDTIYSSSGSTPARLAIGSTGNVLTVAGGVPTWAAPASSGGMTLLETLTLTGNSVTSSTLSSAYKQWVIYLQGVVSNEFPNINMRLNEDTGNNYSFQHSEIMTTLATAVSSNSTNLIRIGRNTTESGATYKYNGIITIMRPSDTDSVFIEARGNYYVSGQIQTLTTAIYDNSAAITKFTLFNTADSFSPNTGRAYIYGVN
jgi:hypothetical protein